MDRALYFEVHYSVRWTMEFLTLGYKIKVHFITKMNVLQEILDFEFRFRFTLFKKFGPIFVDSAFCQFKKYLTEWR